MSKFDVIKKALLLNNVCEDDLVVVKTDTTTFSIYFFRMLVLLFYNFAFRNNMLADELFDFVMKNFTAIVDILTTEIEITLLHFCNICDEKLEEKIQLNNKDECLIFLAIQEKVNNKLKKIMEE